MRIPRVRFTVRRLMAAAAVAAWALGYRESLWQVPSPRSLLPPLTALYLAWALLSALRDVFVVPRRAWLVLPALLGMFLAADLWSRQAAGRLEAAADHAWKASIYRLSAEGGHGVIFACGPNCSRSEVIPDAGDEAGRARMQRLADYHGRMAETYGRAAWLFWRLIPPDPPEPV